MRSSPTRLCAARHGAGQRRLAHLQRRRVQLRGARRRRPGHAVRRHHRQGLVPRRRDDPLRPRRQAPARRVGQGHLPAHRRQVRRARQPERRVWRPRHGQPEPQRAPHAHHDGHRAVRRVRHLRAGRHAARLREGAQSEAVHADHAGRRCALQGAPRDRSRHDRAAGGAAGCGGEQLGRSARSPASRSTRPSSAPAPTARSTISRSRRGWCRAARSRRACASSSRRARRRSIAPRWRRAMSRP